MAVDPARPSVPTSRVLSGRYRLLARRGTGFDAAVFDAVDEVEQRRVTVKVIHPDLCADPVVRPRLETALRHAVTIRHPNLASVLDWGTERWNERQVVYLVIEHLGGGSLREIIDRGRRLSPSQALQVGLEASRGLAALHQVQAAHGDIRPSTVVFGDDGVARLVDVGLGEVLGANTWSDPTRVSNERASYGAPELGRDGQVGPAADVYALCVTLLEATSGSVPLVADTAVTTLAGRVDRLMPVSADLGPLAAVLERAGRPDPADRWTAEEFGRALAQASANLPPPAPVPLVSGGLFDAPVDAPTQAVPTVPGTSAPDDPTFPTRRDVGGDLTIVEQTSTPEPTVTHAAVAPVAPTPTAVLPATPASSPAPPPAATPSAWKRLHPLRLLLLAVLGLAVGAALGFALTPVPAHDVPDLVGLERGEALNAISEFGWQVTVSRAPSDTVPVDRVIATDPAAGVSVRQGEPFAMVVSSGPAPRVLVDLTGLTVDEARAQLTEQGLVLQEGAPEFSETVPVGTVLRWSVPSAPTLTTGDTVVIGTPVEVVASSGPSPRTAPDLTGLDPAAATAALEGQGLVANQLPDQQFSDTVPAGAILSQDPPPGTELQRGATVNFVVSKGPDLVPLPPLVGKDLADATATLVAGGFQVGQVTGNQAGRVAQVFVGDVEVPDGSPAPRNAAVSLVLV